MSRHLTIEIDHDSDDDIGALVGAFADLCINKDGTTRVKVYSLGDLVAERFSEDRLPYEPDLTAAMDDEQIEAHNEAMANDPQYRDAIYYERH